jgi:hypothetical protein
MSAVVSVDEMGDVDEGKTGGDGGGKEERMGRTRLSKVYVAD